MKMNEEKELPVAQDIAWQALNDITLLQTCIPGCESIQQKDDGSFEVLITAAVGPIKAKFKGQMHMKDIVAPTSYTLEFSGQGGAVGYGRGEAGVALSPLASGKTLLRYTATASVGGKLAQVGSRLIDMAAQKMAADFFDAFLAELTKRYAAAPQPAPAVVASQRHAGPGLFASFVTWLGRMFGKRAT
ncbi:CoxG family protein [Cupriavidus necator]